MEEDSEKERSNPLFNDWTSLITNEPKKRRHKTTFLIPLTQATTINDISIYSPLQQKKRYHIVHKIKNFHKQPELEAKKKNST